MAHQSTLGIAPSFRWAVIGIGLSILVTTGCQPKNKSMVSRPLPAPSFDGPRVAPRAGEVKDSYAGAAIGERAWKPTPARPWKWIVIHHSATPTGGMAMFDKEHRAKGWDGVGYHFVIGNGTNSRDGQIEVTPRWPVQKWGAHAKTVDNRYNEYGIGICLVGNFDSARPSAKQVQSLSKLVGYLMQQYRISPGNVVGHRDTKATECPGRFVNIAAIRAQASRAVTDASDAGSAAELLEPDEAQTAGVQLLGDASQ